MKPSDRRKSVSSDSAIQKYLSFRLGQESFAVDIASVQEIICMQTVTRVPKSPSHVRGVTNLRGKVISVVDLRAKFGLPVSADGERTCIVVSQLRSEPTLEVVGLLVEDVPEVMDIAVNQIEAPPELDQEKGIVTGLGKVEGKVIILIDIKAALAGEGFELKVQTERLENEVTSD